MSDKELFITGTQARDFASIVDLYGLDLVGIDYEADNLSMYTCVIVVEKTTYITRVRVDAFGVPFPASTEISRKTLEEQASAEANTVQ